MTASGNRQRKAGPTCKACGLPERELVQLDLILSTPPNELDSKLFGDLGIQPPNAPAEWKRFGAIRKAQYWLEERGHAISRQTLVAHYNKHVTAVVASDSDRALREGRLSDGSPVPREPEPLLMAIEYHNFFKLGMRTGFRALELLAQRMEDTKAPPSYDLLLRVASIGNSLAKAQAAIVTKGMRFVLEDDEAIEGFMGGGDDDDDPSPRFGSYRIRNIEGVRRPVRDEGPADRLRYNERARQEGSPLLPGPDA